MRRLDQLRAELRQRRHHRAFRISAPFWTEAQAAALAPVLDQDADLDEEALATAATNLWRALRKLDQPGERPSARERQAARYLRTCAEALTEAGAVVQDHDGDAFNAGRAVEVLVYQEDPSLAAETVLETVRPSVYLHGRLIQMGQVIVGTPTRQPEPLDGRNDHA